MTAEEFRSILAAPEGTRLEFKEAANRYDFDELVRYCVAIANEGGGRIVLGVTDARPRRVVGTAAFPEPGQTESSIFQRVGHHVSIEEFHHDGHRVLIVSVPARFAGTAWNDRGAYWMRAGESLLPMTDERLRVIHTEVAPDFSGEICADASLQDLAPEAIAEFRRRWSRREGNARVDSWSDDEVLRNAELTRDGRLTYAALLLFGTRDALTRHVAQRQLHVHLPVGQFALIGELPEAIKLLGDLAEDFLQEILAEVPVPHLQIDVFLDNRVARFAEDRSERWEAKIRLGGEPVGREDQHDLHLPAAGL